MASFSGIPIILVRLFLAKGPRLSFDELDDYFLTHFSNENVQPGQYVSLFQFIVFQRRIIGEIAGAYVTFGILRKFRVNNRIVYYWVGSQGFEYSPNLTEEEIRALEIYQDREYYEETFETEMQRQRDHAMMTKNKQKMKKNTKNNISKIQLKVEEYNGNEYKIAKTGKAVHQTGNPCPLQQKPVKHQTQRQGQNANLQTQLQIVQPSLNQPIVVVPVQTRLNTYMPQYEVDDNSQQHSPMHDIDQQFESKEQDTRMDYSYLVYS
ncbi:hypothetical protein FGO68_gene5447 [Halteria grandinella]|uniref:Uncharacterized protein n=1 Tax=Halteria grandinella TaxID=5974 RepID=A0A8J8NDD8_HALGN|nr:hypothetical protein FGO68_gene5447 [Halteria grandinella]